MLWASGLVNFRAGLGCARRSLVIRSTLLNCERVGQPYKVVIVGQFRLALEFSNIRNTANDWITKWLYFISPSHAALCSSESTLSTIGRENSSSRPLGVSMMEGDTSFLQVWLLLKSGSMVLSLLICLCSNILMFLVLLIRAWHHLPFSRLCDSNLIYLL